MALTPGNGNAKPQLGTKHAGGSAELGLGAPSGEAFGAAEAVPPGYKLTEVGVIPEDWKCNKLDSLINPGTAITYGIVQAGPEVMDGVPYIKTGDMSGNRLPLEGLAKTSKDIAARFPRSTIRAGELVYSIRASVGAVHWVPPELDGANLTQGTARISPSASVSEIFLLHALRSKACQNWVDRNTKGSTYREITLEKLRELPVALPSTKAEQQAIAEALSDADALIESLEQLITKKRQIKQGAMQELLTGKRRLPGFESNVGYKQTELGEIPNDWNIEIFSNVTDLITWGGAATPQYVGEQAGFPFLSSSNVKNGKINWVNFKFIDEDLHQQLYKNNPPKLGDVLYSRVGTIGEAAVIDVDFQFSIYVSLTLIKPKPVLQNYFLMHLLNSQPYKQRAKDQVFLGGGVGNLNVDVVRRYPIPLPTVEEQTAIATLLSDMDTEITTLETKLAKARQLKQGMMQQLLTGRIRLVENPSNPCVTAISAY